MTGLPDEATRRLISGFMRWVLARTRAAAFAIEDKGFRAAAARAVVTGLLAVVRPPVPVSVFGARDEAVRWLGTHLGLQGQRLDDMTRAVRVLGV